jgi:tetratricopeptide (TPR) repeat protein
MRRWIAGICLCFAVTAAAQENEAARANQLFQELKRLEALPLYEDLARKFPNEMLYADRLADCLGAKSAQVSDPAELIAIRTRMRDAAKRAVELGDTTEYIRIMANIDPTQSLYGSLSGPGEALLKEAEKAYAAGDFPAAMEKYTAAAAADPKLYEAPLFAGDTAFVQGDLKTAATWFARAIAIDPDRETAYRYWGDAILKYGHDPEAAKEKFIDAIVAEPYNKLAHQGIQQWAEIERATVLAPKVEVPGSLTVDPKNPKNIKINIDPTVTNDKQHPSSAAWLGYLMARVNYRNDQFKKDHPDEKEYRHSLDEELYALGLVVAFLNERKVKPEEMDESLRNLMELDNAGMLACGTLISGADEGIAQDYDGYRKGHRQLLHNYLERFVVHGGVNPAK